MQLKVAKRKNAFLRVGLFGASGSGKTFSALNLAYGLTGDLSKVVVVDTEKGSASLYSDHFEGFMQFELEAPYSPERYIYAINACAEAGIPCLIIDSISHEWSGVGGCLEISSEMKGNSYTNWKHITPRHNNFIDAILNYPGHVIACGRVKDDVVLNTNEKGKVTPEKIGLKVETRGGFDYEMTVAFDLNQTHKATCSKDRTGIFNQLNNAPLVLEKRHGEILAHWAAGETAGNLIKNVYAGAPASKPRYLNAGDVPMAKTEVPANQWGADIARLMTDAGLGVEEAREIMQLETLEGKSPQVLEDAYKKLKSAIDAGVV